MPSDRSDLPVAVIGAGPVGLAAVAHLIKRGLKPLLLEKGPAVGHALRAWGHVRVFSPWRYNIDDAARELLEAAGWTSPDPEGLPTGGDIARLYLEPLAAHPEIAPRTVLGADVLSIGREGLDKSASAGRDTAPFVVRWRSADGERHEARARAVIDATGTWFSPNPMGVDGGLVSGEAEASDRITYGIPDVRGTARQDYAGARVLVVGAGHSAVNGVVDLLKLQASSPGTSVLWAMRRLRREKLFGGGLNDKLPARGALGRAAKEAIEKGRLQLLAPFAAEQVVRLGEGLRVLGRLDGEPFQVDVDRIVVATGFRPSLDMLRELRVSLDPVLEAPPALAPLIDPNHHSCGTVPPHGVEQLSHPEPGFYIIGSKSYGRAPTFLMLTGYEQARSVVAEIAGDSAAARDVRRVLPETGVCGAASGPRAGGKAGSGCCGGPAPKGVDACCVKDADAKAAGKGGCGCGTPSPSEAVGAGSCGARKEAAESCCR
jgi:thioredoxin reductase